MRITILFMVLVAMLLLQSCKKEDQLIMVNAEPEEGVICVSPYESNLAPWGQLLVLDKYGKTITNKSTAFAALNFQKWQVDDKVRYTYLEANSTAYHIAPLSIMPSYGVVLDENFNEIKRVQFHPLINEPKQTSLDSHDFIYLDDNHFITVAYIEKTVSNIPSLLNPAANCKVVAPVIQEVLNDKVVFNWDGSLFPEFYTQSVEGNNFKDAGVIHDYMHLNSIFVDPKDNNIICSFRHLNQVVKIDRVSGNIVWRLGGTNSDFPLTAGMKFLRQHNVTITDDNTTLLIYDNGEAEERPYTRVVEFTLNEASKIVTSFKATNVPGIFSAYMGSVQKRGNTYFIGCGSVPKIMELNFETGVINFSMTLSNNSYRAFKY